mmetsp:Transcript_52006/g.122014  ORF Transcript_52006/g.122014 Transcript_52006/m.122014 type:complete len:131 (-) Transcript_52006:42-434(-)
MRLCGSVACSFGPFLAARKCTKAGAAQPQLLRDDPFRLQESYGLVVQLGVDQFTAVVAIGARCNCTSLRCKSMWKPKCVAGEFSSFPSEDAAKQAHADLRGLGCLDGRDLVIRDSKPAVPADPQAAIGSI